MLVRFAFGTTAVVQDVVSGGFVVRHVETHDGFILAVEGEGRPRQSWRTGRAPDGTYPSLAVLVFPDLLQKCTLCLEAPFAGVPSC